MSAADGSPPRTAFQNLVLQLEDLQHRIERLQSEAKGLADEARSMSSIVPSVIGGEVNGLDIQLVTMLDDFVTRLDAASSIVNYNALAAFIRSL